MIRFQQGCENSILALCGKIVTKFIIFRRFPFFSTFGGSVCGSLGKSFQQSCRNCIPYGYRNILKKLFLESKPVFWMLLVSDQNFSAFCRNFLAGVVRTGFYVSLGKSWRQVTGLFSRDYSFSLFLDLKWKVFGLQEKNYRQGCQICLLRVLQNILRKHSFLGKIHNFKSLSDLERKFLALWEKLFGSFVKTVF